MSMLQILWILWPTDRSPRKRLPKAMLCPEPSALAAAWIRAAEEASNLVKLDFPGAPVLGMQADNKPAPATQVNVSVNPGADLEKQRLLLEARHPPGARAGRAFMAFAVGQFDEVVAAVCLQ